MSCKKNFSKSKIQFSKLPPNIKVLFFYGGNELIEDEERGNIFLECGDCYEDLPSKTLNIIKYIYAKYPGMSIIKIDDNLDIFDSKHLDYISNKLHKSDINYCGQIRDKRHANRTWHFGKCSSDDLNKKEYTNEVLYNWCDGGHGYYLSPYSILSIINLFDTNPGQHLYEDMMIGEYLGVNDIYPVGYSLLSSVFYDPQLSENSLC